MRILALETSLRLAHLAVLENDQLVLETALDESVRSAKTITPGIQKLLSEVDWSLNQIDLIAVSTGPGSFTGLRLGVTTAKTLAYATGAKVIGLNTLEVIAAQVPEAIRSVCTVMNAQRRELFVANFHRDTDGRMVAVDGPADDATKIVDEQVCLSQLPNTQAVSGPGLENLLELVSPMATIIDQAVWHPQAETAGKIAYHQANAGRTDDLWQLLPNYFRRSAAEEEWDKLGK